MSYCNSGPAVLATVIEKVSGQQFEDYVREHFFIPLRMDTASYFLTPNVEQRLTKLYRSDGVTLYPYWHIAYRAAGSVNASAKEMANYVRFCLQRGGFDGTKLLLPPSIERMETTETLPAAKLGYFAGYGLYNDTICEGPFVFRGHGGGLIIGAAERTSARSSSPGPLPLGRREGESSPVHLRREVHEEPRCFLTLIGTMNRPIESPSPQGRRLG